MKHGHLTERRKHFVEANCRLDQTCVEDFIRDLVEVVPVRLEMTKE